MEKEFENVKLKSPIEKEIKNSSYFVQYGNYLRSVSSAFWYSLSARSNSRERMLTSSKVADIPVRSFPLLQLVNLRPEWTVEHIIYVDEYNREEKYHSTSDIFVSKGWEYPHFCSSYCSLHSSGWTWDHLSEPHHYFESVLHNVN